MNDSDEALRKAVALFRYGLIADVLRLAPGSPDIRRALAGWPRAVAHPRLPQIRACAIDALGSSDDGLAAQRYTLCTTRGGGSG